jgi:hypothetical protein
VVTSQCGSVGTVFLVLHPRGLGIGFIGATLSGTFFTSAAIDETGTERVSERLTVVVVVPSSGLVIVDADCRRLGI